MKINQNLCLSGETTEEIGPCTRPLVRLWIEIMNDEGVIFGGRQRALVVARLLSNGTEDLFCCLYTAKKQMSQTNRSMPDEPCKWPCILSVNLSRIANSQA